MKDQINLKAALELIYQDGGALDHACLQYLIHGEHPSAEVASLFFSPQLSVGGWAPPWMPGYSSLDATCYRLSQARQMGIVPDYPAMQQAAGFLVQRQAPDGSWQEDASIASAAPPWAVPGDLAARLYLTANCGLWCLMLGVPASTFQKASDHLLAYLDPSGKIPGFLHTHWLSASLWFGMGLVFEAELTLAYLVTRMDDLALSNLPWLITSLRATGIPAAHPLLKVAASRLRDGQRADGSWLGENSLPAGRIRSTLEALHALAQCGMINAGGEWD